MTALADTAEAARAAEFPPGVDVAAVLAPMRHSAWTTSADYRRTITRLSPLAWSLTYFGPRIRNSSTGAISFSPMHLDMCQAARRWIRGGAYRDAWIAPRESGKSVWQLRLLPLWALAHGHRNFFVAFANIEKQARVHLRNVVDELRDNELLLHDFPGLRITKGGASDVMRLDGGAAIAARGMGETSLGLLAGAHRPDLIAGDDLEKGEMDNSDEQVRQNRARLLQNIVPMNSRNGVIQVSGTVTRYNSLIHEFVHAAKGRPGGEWVRGNGFEPRYYSPVLPDGTSMWPQQWPIEWLQAEEARNPHGYALNYLNDPGPPSEQVFWTDDLWQYDERFPVAARVLHVDPATTTNANSDYTALAMVAVDAPRRRALVEELIWGKWSAPEIHDRIHELCGQVRVKPLVRVESSQGGDTWLHSLGPWPVGVKYETTRPTAPKNDRIRAAHAHYYRRAVWHTSPGAASRFERELVRWHPRVAHDDPPDALAGALAWAFEGGGR